MISYYSPLFIAVLQLMTAAHVNSSIRHQRQLIDHGNSDHDNNDHDLDASQDEAVAATSSSTTAVSTAPTAENEPNTLVEESPPVHIAVVKDKTFVVPECESLSGSQVCKSIFWVNPSQLTKESTFCSCKECESDVWQTDGKISLTWYHYERTDWKIQYQFCASIISALHCSSSVREKTVAVLGVRADGWQPSLISSWCRCTSDHYYLQGWQLMDKINEWHYNYTCFRPICRRYDACLKQYFDRSLTQTTGYRFICSCAAGTYCPIDRIEAR